MIAENDDILIIYLLTKKCTIKLYVNRSQIEKRPTNESFQIDTNAQPFTDKR